MNRATRVTVSTFGAVAGIAGIEHGIGEIRQGNVTPEGLVILSWPDSELFAILAGEPALTMVPNLLVAGLLTILVSLVFLVWAVFFVPRRHGGLGLLLLSALLFLVGGGFGPPLLGIVLGLTATRLRAPLTWLRSGRLSGLRGLLAHLWPWALAVALLAWLLLFPGLIIIDAMVGVPQPDFVLSVLIFSAVGLLLLTIVAGLARDAQRQRPLQPVPPAPGSGSS